MSNSKHTQILEYLLSALLRLSFIEIVWYLWEYVYFNGTQTVVYILPKSVLREVLGFNSNSWEFCKLQINRLDSTDLKLHIFGVPWIQEVTPNLDLEPKEPPPNSRILQTPNLRELFKLQKIPRVLKTSIMTLGAPWNPHFRTQQIRKNSFQVSQNFNLNSLSHRQIGSQDLNQDP